MDGIAVTGPKTFAVAPPREGYAVNEGYKARPADPKDSEKKLREQATELVAGTFFRTLMKAMRDTVPKDEMFGGGRGEEVFRGMFDRELSTRFAKSGNFPVVDAAVRQLEARAAGAQGLNRTYHQRMPRRCGEPNIGTTAVGTTAVGTTSGGGQ